MKKQLFSIVFLILANAHFLQSSNVRQLEYFEIEKGAGDVTPFLLSSDKSSDKSFPTVYSNFISFKDRETGNPVTNHLQRMMLKKYVSQAVEQVLGNVTVADDGEQTVVTLGQGQKFFFNRMQKPVSALSVPVKFEIPVKISEGVETPASVQKMKEDYKLEAEVKAIKTKERRHGFEVTFKQKGKLMFSIPGAAQPSVDLTPSITFFE